MSSAGRRRSRSLFTGGSGAARGAPLWSGRWQLWRCRRLARGIVTAFRRWERRQIPHPAEVARQHSISDRIFPLPVSPTTIFASPWQRAAASEDVQKLARASFSRLAETVGDYRSAALPVIYAAACDRRPRTGLGRRGQGIGTWAEAVQGAG